MVQRPYMKKKNETKELSFVFFRKKEKKKPLPEKLQAFEITENRTSQSCFLSSNSLSESGNPFICKLKVITDWAHYTTWFVVRGARGSKLYPSNKQHMLNKVFLAYA